MIREVSARVSSPLFTNCFILCLIPFQLGGAFFGIIHVTYFGEVTGNVGIE